MVKWGLDPDLAEMLPYVASQIGELRRRGCVVPAIMAYGPLAGRGYGWVQQHMPGSPATVLDSALLSDLVELIDRFGDAPAGAHRSDFGYWVPAVVFGDAAGWWVSAMAAGPEVAAFCHRLRAWVGEPTARSASRDFVHGDLNLANVLVADGRLTAVVDVENLGIGDRGIDVARLLFEWHRLTLAGSPDLAADGHDVLVALGRDIAGDAGWRLAVAYELVSRLGWRSEHRLEGDIDAVLVICAEVLDAVR